MTTKHTPLYLRAIDLEGAGIDLRFICTDDEEINEQAKRNAHLIAAAPDLLELLERAVRRLEIAHPHGDTIMREWVIDARAAITTNTRAILPVHLYGQPADMDAIMAIAREFRLKVVEDVAHQQGSAWRGVIG